MTLSLNQAAKQGQVAKTTIQRALKNGELSGSKNDAGQWAIEESEFGRWLSARSAEQDIPGSENHHGTPIKPPETSALEREVELLRERLGDKDDVIDDLRQRLDDERAERVRLTALLTDQREKSPEKPPERSSWWRGIFSR